MKKLLPIILLSGYSIANCDLNAIKLVFAYPQIKKCENNRIYLQNGKSFIYDDGRKKSFKQLLNHPDIEDMFKFKYPRGFNIKLSKNYDPGRVRYEPLFKEIYGHSAKEVKKHLTTINWFGQKIKVTKVNGVDRALRAVRNDLAKLPKSYKKFLTPIGGTFKWRYIAGTKRLSVHSFGAAIDINVKYSAYWRWSRGAYKYQNRIPKEIVKAFERHGFIWGGKWYHYDTMHFEYRPELLK